MQLASLPALASVVMMAFFVFVVFGIIAVQLWAGVFDGECGRGSGVPCAIECNSKLCLPAYGDTCPIESVGVR